MFTMQYVKTKNKFLLPALLAAASFFCMLLLGLLTSPVRSISLAVVFFIGVLTFLINIGQLLVYLQTDSISQRTRRGILIIAFFVVVILMFRSLQALNAVDAIALFIIALGLLFYSSRRAV